MRRVLIVGAGQAGARCAAALRRGGWDGEIVLIGDEAHLPYERPPLSKEVLSGGDPLRSAIFPAGQYEQLGVDLRLDTRVAAIEPEASCVRLGSGEALAYDVLVLATGARARTLDAPGAALDGVLSLRTADDALDLARRMSAGGSVVLIGGGFIGLEVAAKAVELGCKATVLDAAPALLTRLFAGYLGEVLAPLHLARGVQVRGGVQVQAILGDGAVRAVRLASGETIPADVVVVGVGAVANDTLAAAAGLDCDDGVLVDASGRTSAANIFAIGDVARQRQGWSGPMARLESWENAEVSAAAVAGAILGKPAAVHGAPWFWTDQHGQNVQLLGGRREGDQLLVRGDPAGPAWCAFFHDGRRVHGAVLVNSGRERRWAKRLIDEAVEAPLEALRDPQQPLAALFFNTTPQSSRKVG